MPFSALHMVCCWMLLASLPAMAAEEGGGAPASALEKRIQAASAGDTLVVNGGIHEGNFVLDKRLTLVGIHRPILRGNGKGNCLVIRADSCTVRGFTIEHSGNDLTREDTGIFLESDHNTVADNELRDVLFGMYFLESDFNRVTGNIIRGGKPFDLGQRGDGIHIWNSYHNYYADNVITDTRDGFYMQYANHTLIERNVVHSLRYGLHYMYADTNVFLSNTFYDNVAGAAIMYSTDIQFRHNAFIQNRGYASYGILFQDCHEVRADSNVIADNVVGMFFEASTDNVFHHNLIARNDLALKMFQNSVDNTFTENNFIDNLNPLIIVGKRTGTSWSSSGRGNYWSGYEGYDLDHDGIGDIPMKIQNAFEYLEAHYPSVRLYLYSPASQALAVATYAFPIIALNQEEDKEPLIESVELQQMPAVQRANEIISATLSRNARWDTAAYGVPAILLLVLGSVGYHMMRRGAA